MREITKTVEASVGTAERKEKESRVWKGGDKIEEKWSVRMIALHLGKLKL